jgi:sulfate adenylyltransferase
MMMDRHYPKEKVLLAAFSTFSRYAGPREAVFTALCRKNFGCSHFIVGRDHTGVGSYYKPEDSQILFKALGNIGITPIFFENVYYCETCGQYVERCEHGPASARHISGSQARQMLKNGQQPPEWFMRVDISCHILSELAGGKDVFVG